MKIATISQAKDQLSALLDLVRSGERVLITDRNQPVARLEPVAGAAGGEDARLARLERAGLLRRPSHNGRATFLALPKPKLKNGWDARTLIATERAEDR